MNKRKKSKNVFSWISFIGGISSFILVFCLAISFLYIINANININGRYIYFLIFIFFAITIISIILGIYGIYGEVNKYIRLRSFVGFILGHLYFGLFCFFFVNFIE